MSEPAAELTLREHAVARALGGAQRRPQSLDRARLRAEARVRRFLDVTFDLMCASTGDFTVQEVVDRAGHSLRSFYLHFAGKDELLLTLFEETVRRTADTLREASHASDDPLERLRVAVIGYHATCGPADERSRAPRATPPQMVEFAQQMLLSRPGEAARAFRPMSALFEELLDQAAQTGAIRVGFDHRRLAGIMLEAIMYNSFATTLAGRHPGSISMDDAAGELWILLLEGIAAIPAA